MHLPMFAMILPCAFPRCQRVDLPATNVSTFDQKHTEAAPPRSSGQKAKRLHRCSEHPRATSDVEQYQGAPQTIKHLVT